MRLYWTSVLLLSDSAVELSSGFSSPSLGIQQDWAISSACRRWSFGGFESDCSKPSSSQRALQVCCFPSYWNLKADTHLGLDDSFVKQRRHRPWSIYLEWLRTLLFLVLIKLTQTGIVISFSSLILVCICLWQFSEYKRWDQSKFSPQGMGSGCGFYR